jgi:hypothetical protein
VGQYLSTSCARSSPDHSPRLWLVRRIGEHGESRLGRPGLHRRGEMRLPILHLFASLSVRQNLRCPFRNINSRTFRPCLLQVGDRLHHCVQSPAGPSLRPPFRQKVRRDDPLCRSDAPTAQPRAWFSAVTPPAANCRLMSSILLAPGRLSVPLLARPKGLVDALAVIGGERLGSLKSGDKRPSKKGRTEGRRTSCEGGEVRNLAPVSARRRPFFECAIPPPARSGCRVSAANAAVSVSAWRSFCQACGRHSTAQQRYRGGAIPSMQGEKSNVFSELDWCKHARSDDINPTHARH